MKLGMNKLLDFIPCALAALGLAAFVFILRAETDAYRRAVETWAERDLAARTQLASEAIRESLATGDFAHLRSFADAHRSEDVGKGLREGCALLEACGYRYVTVYRERKPCPVRL